MKRTWRRAFNRGDPPRIVLAGTVLFALLDLVINWKATRPPAFRARMLRDTEG